MNDTETVIIMYIWIGKDVGTKEGEGRIVSGQLEASDVLP